MTGRLEDPAPASRPARTGSVRRAGRRFTVTALAASLASGLLLAACGIPTQKLATPIASVPSRILSPATTTTTPQTVSGYAQVYVYFTTGSSYVLPEPRFLKPPPKLSQVVALLLAGPTSAEQYTGVETALGPGVKLLSMRVTDNVVTLNFSADFGELSGYEEVLGVAQVVDTVAADKGAGFGVLFQIDGVPTDVPVETGGLVSGPVHASQYSALIFPTAPPTTVAS